MCSLKSFKLELNHVRLYLHLLHVYKKLECYFVHLQDCGLLSQVKMKTTLLHNAAQHCWVNVERCWPRVLKQSQHVGRCCMELIPQGDMGSIFTQKPFQNHGYQASSGHAQAQQCCANKPLRFNSHKNKRNNGRCGVKSLNDFKLHVTCANIMQHCPVSCTSNLNMWHPTILAVLFQQLCLFV